MLRVLLNRYKGESPQERAGQDDAFLRANNLRHEDVAHEDFGKDRAGMYVSAFTFHERDPMACETQRPQEHKRYHDERGKIDNEFVEKLVQEHTKSSPLEQAADSLKEAQLDRKRWEDALHLVQESVNACNDRILAAEIALRMAVEER